MNLPFALAPRATAVLCGLALTWAAHAVEVVFKPVAPGVYAYVSDTEGRTDENEALNANIGLVVTSAGAVLIDPGATFKTGATIAAAAKAVTPQPINRVFDGGASHLLAWREHLRLTQAELADRMGISQVAYAQMEAAKRPRKATLQKVAHAMGLELEQLVW